jgi:hypothetical protein
LTALTAITFNLVESSLRDALEADAAKEPTKRGRADARTRRHLRSL